MKDFIDNLTVSTKDLFTNFFNINGRLSRAGYWWAFLAYIIISMVVSAISNLANMDIIPSILALAYIIPFYCAAVRRYHDVGKSGWMYFGICVASGILSIIAFMITVAAFAATMFGGFSPMFLIAFLFWIVSLAVQIFNYYILTRPSDKEANQYGNPVPFATVKASSASDSEDEEDDEDDD